MKNGGGRGEKTVAIIPMRGGSRAIKKKNIGNFAGKPLAYWVLRAAHDCEVIDEVYVSTDDKEITETVRSFGLERLRFFPRSKESATDSAPTEVVLIELAKQKEFDIMVLLQATSPFTTSEDLSKAFVLYENENYDSMLSVVRQRRFLWNVKEGEAKPINYDYRTRQIRQEFEGFFMENGAFYINTRKNLLEHGNRLYGKIGVYVMPDYSGVEIDEPHDWIIAEELFMALHRKERRAISSKDLRKIEVLALDVDGVLTDGNICCSAEGESGIKFSRIDGKGIERFLGDGKKVIVISSENSEIVRRRMEKLKVDAFLGVTNKKAVLQQYLDEHGLSFEQTAFVGDDIQDVEAMKATLCSFCPADGQQIVKNNATYVCKNKGGMGAVREVIELILSAGEKNDVEC